MNILYLAAFKANHPNWNITYQDINGNRDIDGDMMDVNLNPYDVIIATPPCNYYSRANYRRETSEYSQATKHLLPSILKKLIQLDKPCIVENVRSPNLYKELGLFNLNCHVYFHGRHTYWTNIPFNYQKNQIHDDIHNSSKSKRQGGQNVHDVIEYWLNLIK
jgi:hypothetical protein